RADPGLGCGAAAGTRADGLAPSGATARPREPGRRTPDLRDLPALPRRGPGRRVRLHEGPGILEPAPFRGGTLRRALGRPAGRLGRCPPARLRLAHALLLVARARR